MNNHILFVHIPKTAGTSFRIAAQDYFEDENTFFDYSPLSIDTSKEVIKTIYDAKDPYRFYSILSKRKHSFFSGHFSVTKYAPLYDTLNVVSFVRDPVAQVLSHYNHHKNYNGYEKSFIDFIKEPRFRNIQFKSLGNKPIALYGFIGLTEAYNSSIDLFNAIYDTKLQHKHMNIKNEGSLNIEDIDEKTVELIRRVNAKDTEFYESVKQQFQLRQKLYAKKLPFTHTAIQQNMGNKISGWAFQRGSDEAVEINIYAGEIYLETVLAKNLRPGQVQKHVPRRGFIGFDYLYVGDADLEGKLRAFVKRTGQEIV